MTRKKRGRKRKRHPNHYRFTREDCQKGYQRALEIMTDRGWDALAFFLRKIRSHYRKEKRDGPQEKDRRRAPA